MTRAINIDGCSLKKSQTASLSNEMQKFEDFIQNAKENLQPNSNFIYQFPNCSLEIEVRDKKSNEIYSKNYPISLAIKQGDKTLNKLSDCMLGVNAGLYILAKESKNIDGTKAFVRTVEKIQSKQENALYHPL